MQNKPSAKNWNDVRLIFSSISIALTLGFWGLFASTEKAKGGMAGQIASGATDPVASPQPQMMLLPGQKLLFGSTASTSPQSQPQTVAAAKPRKSKNNGGGRPVATTGSSKP